MNLLMGTDEGKAAGQWLLNDLLMLNVMAIKS